jgi:hypothetical protein
MQVRAAEVRVAGLKLSLHAIQADLVCCKTRVRFATKQDSERASMKTGKAKANAQ